MLSRAKPRVFLNFFRSDVKLRVRSHTLLIPVSILFWAAFTAGSLAAFLYKVDLKPKVDEHFFFSSEDPQFQEDKMIAQLFPQPPQVIIAAKGDIRTGEYTAKIEKLSEALSSLPEVFGLQSLTRGPKSLEDALESPLWSRVLIAEDGQASLIFVFIKNVPLEPLVLKIEKITGRFHQPDFQLMISGAPYIVELIRRKLFDDLKIFTVVALLSFSLALLAVFHSWWIMAGTIVACFNASAVTLILARLMNIEIGFLTANLSTIVFVLTLSHIVFLTASWRQLLTDPVKRPESPAWEAARSTLTAALWSTFTALLGFLTLLFVQAKSLRQLGISGSLGTLISFLAAYGIYPWFLSYQKGNPQILKRAKMKMAKSASFFAKKQGGIVLLTGFLFVLTFFGLRKLDTDSSLFDYFKKGSILRQGLEYIDRNGGSNPLSLVIMHPDVAKFNNRKAYRKLWRLHLALEKDPAVGHVVSLPTILGEARRSPWVAFMSFEWLLSILESPTFGEVARYFITEDRTKTLFFLRMREMKRETARLEVVNRIEKIVESSGFVPVLTGGVYVLQGRLSELVSSSLISGSILINLVFLIMGWIISRSLRVSFAMLLGLYFVPVAMLGILGHLKVPLDVISAPAANVAIGMGSDSLIHMIIMVREYSTSMGDWASWAKVRARLWEPILWSNIMVGAGFSIFALSNFPPTQRFGFSVVLGMILSPLAALFIFPWFATFSGLPRKNGVRP